MIKPLRNLHFYSWRVLVLFIGILFILAIYWRPKTPSSYSPIETIAP